MMKVAFQRLLLLSMVIITTIWLGSCSLPGVGSSDNELVGDLSRTLSPFQVLDLNTGVVTGRTEIADLATADIYRESLMVFRRIDAGETQIGTATGELGSGVDPVAKQVTVGQFYLGVFEVTQAQWLLISGAQPWVNVSVFPANSFGSTATVNNRAAFGLGRDMVFNALTSYNSNKAMKLSLPTDEAWERACRAGSTSAFAWGTNPLDANALSNAVVSESLSTPGSKLVGERQPNAFGIYDMHGNVWELTQTGLTTNIRGGSWRDAASLSRAGNVVAVDRATPHGLVGARLVLTP